MSYQGRNRTIKNPNATTNKGKRSITVSEYIQRNEFRKNRTWRLSGGKWYVDCEGVWLLEKDFNRLFPIPIVPNFNHDVTNADRRNIYLYE